MKSMKEKILAFLNENGLYIILGVFLIAAAATDIYMQKVSSTSVVIYNNDKNGYEETSISSAADSDISAASDRNSSKSKSTTTVKTTMRTETTKENPQTETNEPTQFPVDINRVTKEQLMEINGIGEITADKIISYRSEIGVIYNMDILTDISGIGESTLALLKEYLYVSETDYRDIEEYTVTEEPVQTVTSSEAENNYEEIPTETTAVSTTSQTTEPVRQCVNVNEADAEEISEKLLIDIELAQSIVDVREQIQGYTNSLELLYAKGMTESQLSELWDYIIL